MTNSSYLCKVLCKWIDTATAHGVNTFMFDWYWYKDLGFDAIVNYTMAGGLDVFGPSSRQNRSNKKPRKKTAALDYFSAYFAFLTQRMLRAFFLRLSNATMSSLL